MMYIPAGQETDGMTKLANNLIPSSWLIRTSGDPLSLSPHHRRTTVGIYGLLSYAVEQKAQEIGIRMALGASRNQILGMILRQGMTLTGVGIVIGSITAFGLVRLLVSIIPGMSSVFCGLDSGPSRDHHRSGDRPSEGLGH